jgi:hypothetical protein
LPLGAPEHRPPVELCVIPRSAQIDTAERALHLALVAVIGGTRLLVTIAGVKRWIQEQYAIPADTITVRRFHPEDFLVTFSFYDDLLRVLHDPPLPDPNLQLIFKRWRRQHQASVESLLFEVTMALRGVPGHAWNEDTGRQILAPACSKIKLSLQSAAGPDLRSLVVRAWCIHPDLIPQEKIIFIPEPDVGWGGGSLLEAIVIN